MKVQNMMQNYLNLIKFTKHQGAYFVRCISSLNLPKRPPNAYSEFIREKMDELKKSDDPDRTFKHLANMWKNMSPEEKNVFYVKQHGSKQLYDNEMTEFYEKTSIEDLLKWKHEIQATFDVDELHPDNIEKNIQKETPEISDPLKPPTSFEMWMRDPKAQSRSDRTDSRQEDLKGPKEAWLEVSNEEKQKYEEKYQDYLKKYSQIKEAIALIREWNHKLQELKQGRQKHHQLTSEEKIVQEFLTQSTPLIDSKRPTVQTIKKVSETIEVHREN